MKQLILLFIACVCIPAFAQKEAVYEHIEWTNNWLESAGKTDKPHVLLIGNSIVMGCYPIVKEELGDNAYVSRLCNSKCIGDPALWDDLKLVLKYHRFDVIQFNNGLHGYGYSEETYEQYFPKYLKLIKKYQPQAKLIWVTSTPTWTPDMKQHTDYFERTKIRNKIALKYIIKAGIEVNDIWSTALAHPEYFEGGDGVHPNKDGWKALGSQEAAVIEKYL